MEPLAELPQFLELGTRSDVKLIALQHILGLSTDINFCKKVTNDKYVHIVNCIVNLLNDSSQQVISTSLSILLNLSADLNSRQSIVNKRPLCSSLVLFLYENITNPESTIADECCKIFNNLTSFVIQASGVYECIQNQNLDLNALVSSFVIQDYNKNCNLHYLGRVFGNLATLPEFRQFVLDKDKCVIQRLIPFTGYSESALRREGIAALIKNCCLTYSEPHEYLLGKDVDILPKVLLPLAGGEEFSDEDNEQLPIELQYLPTDKQREPCPHIRKLLLEILLLLCTKKKNREFIRDSNSYLILRELHKAETDKEVLLDCENVVDVLIRTEDEIGVDDLNEVEVAKDLEERFIKMDEEFLKS